MERLTREQLLKIAAGDTTYPLPARWTQDCGGKQDLDCPLVYLSTRFYPDFSAYPGIYLNEEENALARASFDDCTSEGEAKHKAEQWATEYYNRILRAVAREMLRDFAPPREGKSGERCPACGSQTRNEVFLGGDYHPIGILCVDCGYTEPWEGDGFTDTPEPPGLPEPAPEPPGLPKEVTDFIGGRKPEPAPEPPGGPIEAADLLLARKNPLIRAKQRLKDRIFHSSQAQDLADTLGMVVDYLIERDGR